MNCIPSLVVAKYRHALVVCLLLCASCNAQVAEPYTPDDPLHYRIEYIVEPDRTDGSAQVTLRLTQNRALLRELSMSPDDRFRIDEADGDLEVRESGVTWLPPERGGELSWRVDIPHRRNGDGYDAWLGMEWGLFRAEDVIPRAATRTLKGAQSETQLRLSLPSDWSAVTEYYNDNGVFRINNPARRFDQPSGWIVVGDLGVRRETIAGMRVAVAGPAGHSIRRMDTLALLHWTLPELARIVPELPRRLTVVSAGEPMWRGGLSAPQSLYLHAERPLISENATSTLLHEVMHMALGFQAKHGYDWIIEGLAEFYSLQLLQRSGSISMSRYEEARRDIRNWAQSADSLCGPSSTGATTALAVTVFDALNREIADATDSEASLDNVAVALWQAGADVDLDALIEAVGEVTGGETNSLHIDNLPGCHQG